MSEKNMNRPKKKSKIETRDLALCAVMIALALVFSYVERLIPVTPSIPGIKLGLSNLVILCAIYLLGPKYALAISVARIFLAGFMFGTMTTIIYSLAGGLLSFLIMVLLYCLTKMSPIAISCIGGICHNIGQIIVAMIIYENLILGYYLPILMVVGFITGLVIGIVTGLLLPTLRKSLRATDRR